MELINLGQLAEFLVEAQPKCFAGGNEKKLPDGTKVSVFRKGNLELTDHWDASEVFQGHQLVRYVDSKIPIWGTIYTGTEHVYHKNLIPFLKSALSHPLLEMPVRGPEYFVDPNYPELEYFNHWKGKLIGGQGNDFIFYKKFDFWRNLAFELNYSCRILRKGTDWPVSDLKWKNLEY